MSEFRGWVHGLGTPLILVLLAGCKTMHTLDAQQHSDAATAAQIETHETKSEGPEHIVMTVEEFSQLCDPKEEGAPVEAPPVSGRSTDAARPTDIRPTSGTRSAGLPEGIAQGAMIRRTVTVTDRGPSLDDLRTISSLQSKLNQTTKIKTKDLREFLSGLWPYLLCACGASALFLLRPAWLGIAWGFVKALFGRKAS